MKTSCHAAEQMADVYRFQQNVSLGESAFVFILMLIMNGNVCDEKTVGFDKLFCVEHGDG